MTDFIESVVLHVGKSKRGGLNGLWRLYVWMEERE